MLGASRCNQFAVGCGGLKRAEVRLGGGVWEAECWQSLPTSPSSGVRFAWVAVGYSCGGEDRVIRSRGGLLAVPFSVYIFRCALRLGCGGLQLAALCLGRRVWEAECWQALLRSSSSSLCFRWVLWVFEVYTQVEAVHGDTCCKSHCRRWYLGRVKGSSKLPSELGCEVIHAATVRVCGLWGGTSGE